MSHVVTMQTEFKDPQAFETACEALGLTACLGKHSVQLFSGSRSGVMSVKLPGWQYAVVVDEHGQAHFDNYNGSWGKIDELNKLKQQYAAEVTAKKAKNMGYLVQQKRQANGSLQLILRK